MIRHEVLASQCRVRAQTNRRAATYAVVLLTTLLVATIGFSGVAVARLQARSTANLQDVSAARRLACAGLEWSLLKISSDTNWRNALGNGDWIKNFAAGPGTFSVTAADPKDNDVATGAMDPVELTMCGQQKNARHMFRARLEVDPVRSVLDTAVAAGGAFTIIDAQVDALLPIYATGNMTASGAASVRTNCESSGAISGSTYRGTNSSNVPLRAFPNAGTVFDYYNANGTAIPFANISSPSASEIIKNGQMSGTADWNKYGTVNLTSTSSGATASPSAPWLLVTSRGNSSAGPIQDIRANFDDYTSGTYRLRGRVLGGTAGNPMTFRAVFEYKDDDEDYSKTVTLASGATGGAWIPFDVQIALNYSDPPVKTATLRIDTPGSSQDFAIDELSLVQVCNTCARTVENVLISPQVNPYGATNPQGIYIIDCAGNDLVIRQSRIVGTLLIRNPGPNSRLIDRVTLEPAVAHYPSLLVDGNFKIQMDDRKLEENNSTNLNPAGTPYRFSGGATDSDQADKYDSVIHGLVYVNGNLMITNKSTFDRAVVVTGNVTAGKDRLLSRYLGENALTPPPGFENLAPRPRIVPGSVLQVVDP